ncbi:formyltransferase family protein [Oceanospirillum sp.]|uniref:formyltransferase family protein n=1 Tax=Oceanospirillum sp. TaxID=2021254 RepID=UPI003A95006C
MKISFLCSNAQHPVNRYLQRWISANEHDYQIELVRDKNALTGGELLFLISCSQVVNTQDRAQYTYTLVLHASDLPKGRGWSPYIWDIINGAHEITVTLLEAEDKVDSGRIWQKKRVPLTEDMLWDEINNQLFAAELELIDYAVANFQTIQPETQSCQIEPTYYPKRSPEDSQIDPHKTIAEQFNTLRICDPKRFPAYFELHGKRYNIILEKADDK